MNAVLIPESSAAMPLLPIQEASFEAWLERQSEATQKWLTTIGFSAKPGQIALLPSSDGALQLALCGLGAQSTLWSFAHLSQQLPAGDFELHPDWQQHSGAALSTLALGFALGGYRFDRYRAAKRAPARLVIRDAVVLKGVLAEVSAVSLARDLVNTPTEDLGPEHFEVLLRELAARHQAVVRSVVGEALLQENFPAIHAVGRASHRAPRLLEMDWGQQDAPLLILVGKGVCFDTGGLDIKPADGMLWMKKDMGGAAVAFALASWIMQRGLPVRLKLLLPCVENAIGPNAYRPGEVIATRLGLSVEIGNTDAEGRVILCDALTYACEHKPTLLLDYATLTGAARIALGPDLPALFASSDQSALDFLQHATRVADPLWRMPLWDEYHSYLKSTIADINNAGATRMAGCITAALYLKRFVAKDINWLHLDTYCWNDRDRPGRPTGGECQGLRASIAWLEARFQ